jgi:NAD(P)H-nitrite reductase large subunit
VDPRHKARRRDIICRCNEIPRSAIENAIRNGATTLDEIYDLTLAGVGPCGASCRPDLRIILEQYLRDGTFPQGTIPSVKKGYRGGTD